MTAPSPTSSISKLRPDELDILRAEFFDGNPYPYNARKISSSHRAGLAYEKKAIGLLREKIPQLVQSPWIKFRLKGRPHDSFAQPDAFTLEPTPTIFEIKLKHTEAAVFQLFKYRNLMRLLFPELNFALCEVCKHYDPATETIVPMLRIKSLWELYPGQLHVLQLKPRPTSR